MGVSADDALWELQWHSGQGKRVRRLLLTRRGLRRGVWALAVLGLILFVVVSLFPVALKGLFSSFTVEAARRENRARRLQTEELREQLGVQLAALAAATSRARRVAWSMGLPADRWRQPLPAAPASDADDEAVSTWIELASSGLGALEGLLQPATVRPPCDLVSLPLASPVAADRAVPLALFGWRVSPFTGKQMANHGITMACQLGEPILAPGTATVQFVGSPRERTDNEWSRYGMVLVLDHGGGVLSVYGHLRESALRRGQAVARGQKIGTVGQTGWTKVPALYYEVRWPIGGVSKPVDPALVGVGLRVEDLESRLADPLGGLPDDYALVEHLRGGAPVRATRRAGTGD